MATANLNAARSSALGAVKKHKKKKSILAAKWFHVIVVLLFLIFIFSTSRPRDVLGQLTNNVSTSTLPSTKAYKCNKEPVYDNLILSQSGEDRQLIWGKGIRFDKICGGSYIEMGALDGIHFSNSFVFNKALDWKGLLIEASPTNYEALENNRKEEIALIHAGVCGQERDLHWVDKPKKHAVGGFVEFAAESFQKKWWNENDIKYAKVVRCRTMKNILLETVGKNYHFDFYSLDVEGAEAEVLSSIDFSKVSFGVIFVEADQHNPQKNDDVKKILNDNGYEFLYNIRNSDWFRHRDLREIYKDIITFPPDDP
ncbi:hypothetical protein CTEN210_06566 [Chaetoceros tenuissimus]|uniref:Methyltransferase FkbM domain-containing protein n=1 Tax=Chaetoceros tenuissimus TaxID=426638 RepID=A0AAD3H4I4_9STRA|nr:hypothetical protein CTEN210_06566 [Chaetoceros tenuissimus]